MPELWAAPPPTNPYAEKATQVLKADPSLARDPAAVHTLASTQGIDGHTLGQVNRFGQLIGQTKQRMADSANQNGTSGSWWTGLGHFFEGAATGGWDLVKGAARTVNRSVITAGELGTGGLLGAKGFGDFSGNLNDAQQTVSHAVGSFYNWRQPLSPPAWKLAAHVMAYYDSMANRKGVAYALGNITPALLGSMVGGETLAGSGIGSDAVDAGNLARLSAKIDSGTATADDLAHATSIGTRLARNRDPEVQFEHAKMAGAQQAATDAIKAQPNVLFRAGRAAIGGKYSPVNWTIGLGAKALRASGAVGRSLPLQVFHGMAGLQAQGDPSLQSLWQATADGHPLDRNGRPMGTIGQTLADSLGLHGTIDPKTGRESGVAGLVAGSVDAVNLLNSQPLGALSELRAGAKTAQGVGGILGRWWPSLGVETGADVYRTAGNNARAWAAYQFMAHNSAERIARAFPRMYSAEVLTALGKARTVDEVLNIHADIADGAYLARGVAPTLPKWRMAVSAVQKGLQANRGDGAMNVIKDSLRELGFDVKPKAVVDVIPDPMGTARTTFRRWLGKRFLRSTWLIQDAERVGEIPHLSNTSWRAGDQASIPVLAEILRKTGLWDERTISTLTDSLYQSTDPQDFLHAFGNGFQEMLSGAVARNTSEGVFQSLGAEIDQTIQEQIRTWLDAGGGGGPGIYSNGAQGELYSELRDVMDATKTGYYGFGDTHIAHVNFMDPREIRAFSNKLGAVLNGLPPEIVGDGSRLRYLDSVSRQAMAEYKQATLEGIVPRAARLLERNVSDVNKSDQWRLGYETGHAQAMRIIEGARDTPGLGPIEQYVHAVDSVSQLTQQLEVSVGKMSEASGTFWFNRDAQIRTLLNSSAEDAGTKYAALMALKPPDDALLASEQGRLKAFGDLERNLFRQLQEPGRKLSDLRQWAFDAASHSEEKAQASKEVVQAITDKLDAERAANGTFLNKRSLLNDYANKLLGKTFVQFALSTGGYIQRIGFAEMIPNLLRIGPAEYISSRIALSIARHEAAAVPLAKAVVDGVEITEHRLLTNHVLDILNHLSAPVSATKNLMMGALTGAERSLLKGMGVDHLGRLIDDITAYSMAYSSHLPDVSHTSSQLYGLGGPAAGMQDYTYGVDPAQPDKVLQSKMFVGENFKKVEGDTSATALTHNLQRIHVDGKMLPSMKDLKDIIGSEGATAFPTQTEMDALHTRLTDLMEPRLRALPQKDKDLLHRSRMLLPPSISTGDPIRDWAKTIAYNTLAVTHGVARDGSFIFHPDLIDQAVSGKVKSPVSMAAWMAKQGGTAPRYLVDREFSKYPWNTTGANKVTRAINHVLNVPEGLNRHILDPTFGKFISWVSREPIAGWEFHMAMEDLRPRIASGQISYDQAFVEASNRSLQRLTAFVHNPMDRFHFEQATRLYAPFWFAKNQAYRRAFRLMEDNPRAFEQYLKSSLAITQVVAQATKNGQSSLSIPGSEYLANAFAWAFSGFGSEAMAIPMAGKILADFGMGFGATPSSIQTVFPTGGQTGLAMVENLLRPDASPIISVPMKLAAQFDPAPYHRFLQLALGPVGAQTGVVSDLFPSATYRDALTAAEAWYKTSTGETLDTGAVAQLQMKAMQGQFDALLQGYMKRYMGDPAVRRAQGISDSTWNSMSKDQRIVWAQGFATDEMQHFFDTGSPTGYINQQRFLDNTNIAALGLYTGMVISKFASPISISLREQFSKSPDFNKILSQKLPDGSPIPFSQAVGEFFMKDPGHALDLVSHSQEKFGPYPENQHYLNWWQAAPQLFAGDKIPTLISYLIPRTGQFSYPAEQAQLSHGLRTLDTPQQFMDATMTNLGNNWYYNYIEPYFYEQHGQYFGPNDPRNTISYQGYKDLQTYAQHYGKNVNPTWAHFGSPLGIGTQSQTNEINAVHQADKLVTDGTIQQTLITHKLLSSKDISLLAGVMEFYHKQMSLITQPGISGTSKWGYEQTLYQSMNQWAQLPEYSKLAYLMTNVLAKAPTK